MKAALAIVVVLLAGSGTAAHAGANREGVKECLKLFSDSVARDLRLGYGDVTVVTGIDTFECFKDLPNWRSDLELRTLIYRCYALYKSIARHSNDNLGYVAAGHCLGEFGPDLIK